MLTAEEADAFVAEVETMLRAAHDRLKASFGDAGATASTTARSRARRRRRSITAVAAERLVALNDELLRTPEDFTVHPKLARQLERRRVAVERGRHRLGPGRGARVCVAARRRDPGAAHRPGLAARHVLAAAPRAPRRAHRRDVHADAAPRRRERVVRGLQLAALRVRVRRLRVRLLRGCAGGARALGGPVRRLRERRADRDRPVHLVGALEVA